MEKMKLLLCLLAGLALSACSASRGVRDAAQLVDDGKRNSVLLSYEIRLDSHDRYPGFNSTELALRCGPGKSLNPYPVCFYIRVPFAGKREDNGYIYNSFELSGARLYQVRYGHYSLARTSFSVLVGQRRERSCHPVRDRLRYRCYDEYVDVKADFVANLPTDYDFAIGAGDGCYLGHLTLHMRGSKVVSYALDTSFGDIEKKDLVSQLPEQMKSAAGMRIGSPCGK